MLILLIVTIDNKINILYKIKKNKYIIANNNTVSSKTRICINKYKQHFVYNYYILIFTKIHVFQYMNSSKYYIILLVLSCQC